MKRILLLTAVLLTAMALQSQNIFFPSKEGTRLTYENYDKKGKPTGKVMYTIKEVK